MTWGFNKGLRVVFAVGKGRELRVFDFEERCVVNKHTVSGANLTNVRWFSS